MNGPNRRQEESWTFLARKLFPAPLSPSTSNGVRLSAALNTRRQSASVRSSAVKKSSGASSRKGVARGAADSSSAADRAWASAFRSAGSSRGKTET